MSKLSKISKISKFPKITKILNHSCIIIFFLFYSCWPLMSQSLWYSGLRLAPLPPAQPLSLSTTGLNVLHVQNSNLSLKWGGGEQMGTLGKNGAWDDYPNYTWDGLTLNLFCSITFIVKVTHKQQHRFIFFLQPLSLATTPIIQI